jgi:uncharacterized protein
MSERTTYPARVPCWVDNLVPDPPRSMSFYGELLGWEFDGPGPGEYFEARVRDRAVAGLGALPPGVAVGWNTYVSVTSADETARAAVGAGGHVVVEPFDALPAGRVAVLADPSGALIGLWQPAERSGAGFVNEPGAWAMSLLNSRAPDVAGAFYGEVFGWEAESFVPGVSLFRLEGYVGGEPAQPVPRDVVAAMAQGEGPEGWSVDFWVPDADVLADKAPALGGAVIAPPVTDPGGMRHAVLADPDGAAFTVTTAPGH